MIVRYMLLGLFLPLLTSAAPTGLYEPSFPCSRRAIEQYCIDHGTSALAKDVLEKDKEALNALPDEVKGELHELFSREGRSCANRLFLMVIGSTSCFLYGLSNFLGVQSDGEYESFSVVPERSAMIAVGLGASAWGMLHYYVGRSSDYNLAYLRLNSVLEKKRNK